VCSKFKSSLYIICGDMLKLETGTTLHQGGSNFACGANYPHQALKGGYFVFVWRVGT
jgi:hypothetical protein